jgi:preprotein translocase subunit SecE
MQDSTNSKIMTMSFVAMGFLVALVVQVLFENFSVSFGPVARLHANETIRHALPIGAGLITFALLQFNAKVRTWADECISEVRKVVWPSRKDTVAMTTVCCVMVVIVGVLLGVFDFASQHLIKTFVNLNIFH